MSSSGLVPASPVSAVRFGHETSKLPDFELTSSTVPDPSGRPPVQAVWAVRTDMVTPRSWVRSGSGHPSSPPCRRRAGERNPLSGEATTDGSEDDQPGGCRDLTNGYASRHRSEPAEDPGAVGSGAGRHVAGQLVGGEVADESEG